MQPGNQLSFLVPVLSEFFLALMRRDLLFLTFFSAGHVGTPLSIKSGKYAWIDPDRQVPV
jgi:hypothetical protein